MTKNTNVFPSVERIDSRLIASFSVLILIIILVFSSFAGFYYQNIMEKEEQRLALLSSQILNTAINRTSFSGKYHTRLLIEEIANSFTDIKSIEVMDSDGLIIGHSDSSKNGQKINIGKAALVINEQQPFLIQRLNVNGEVIEIMLPYRTGYQNQINGIVRMLISTQAVNNEIYMGFIYLFGLVIIIITIAMFFVRKISHYFAQPVFFMADILKGILEHSPVLIAIQDKNGKVLQCSQNYSYYFPDSEQCNISEVLNQKGESQFKSDEVIENLFEVPMHDELKILRALYFPISLDNQSKLNLTCCIAEDVTEKKRVEQKLEFSKDQLHMVLQGASLGFWDWDYQTGAHDVDLIWQQQLGISESELTYTIEDWEKRIHPEDKQASMEIIQKAIATEQHYTAEFRMKHSSGHWVWIQGSGAVVEWDLAGNPLRLCGTHKDISNLKRNEQELLFLANYDNLTHLPNRNLLKEEIKFLLTQGQYGNKQIALFFIDLDNFKIINDTYGHDFGDLLLVNIAGKIKQNIRDNDMLARFGGDEFVLLISDMDELDSLSSIATNIINTMREPIIIKKQAIYVGLSIGISVYPDDGDNFNLLLRNADTAMYKAKDAGRNQFCFYTPSMNEEIKNHIEIASHLQKALKYNDKTNELFMVYQPQVDVQSGKIKSCEALLRWQDPDKGFISPAVFIPIAEKSSLIIKLSDWVFEEVCRQRKEWHDMGITDLRVDVNLSSRQFTDRAVVHKICSTLKKYQLESKDIGLELTESAIIDSDEHTMTAINDLRNTGFEIAIDDFGTGYSSLSYIKRFPISTIKIDRAFIIDAPTKKDDSAIVRAIIAMAQAMSLKVIAEGVETEAQYQFLKQSHCQLIQGYYFYKPMPADEFSKVILNKSVVEREVCSL